MRAPAKRASGHMEMGLRNVLTKGVGRRAVAAEGTAVSTEAPAKAQPAEARARLRARMGSWLAQLHRDPTAEERAAEERRALLLEELNRTVAEVPDDVPIRDVIDRLNRHWDD